MASATVDLNIRPLKEDECGQLHQMIIDLAEFEKMGGRVENTPDGLRRDIFDVPKRCICLVAEDKDIGILGFALSYYAYSTWQGTYLHLEDLYVKPDFRGKGIGMKLYQATAQLGLDMGAARVELDVLDWNKTAKDFYEKVGNEDITEKEGWHRMRLTQDKMEKFVKM